MPASLIRTAFRRIASYSHGRVLSQRFVSVSFHSSSNWHEQTDAAIEWKNPKEETGRTGLPVVTNARDVLISLYNKTIEKAKSYEDVGYNRLVIRLCEHRMNIVETAPSIDMIEKQIECGHVEEIIEQAEDELELLIELNENQDPKPWEEDPLSDVTFDDYTYPNGITEEMVKNQQEESMDDLMAQVKELGLKLPSGIPSDVWTDPDLDDNSASNKE